VETGKTEDLLVVAQAKDDGGLAKVGSNEDGRIKDGFDIYSGEQR
jgi:hypothetical protein